MKLLWAIWEVVSSLPSTIKKILLFAIIGLVLGIPTSEFGWLWRWSRQIVQVQNCGDDVVHSIMDSMNSADPDAITQMASRNHARVLQKCAGEALQHPQDSIPFLLEQRERLSRLSQSAQ